MIGIFLRRTPQLWREMAYSTPSAIKAVAGPKNRRHGKGVVAARFPRVGTISLNRYPSPVGRFGPPQGRPPTFFAHTTETWQNRQGFAGNRLCADCLWHSSFAMPHCSVVKTECKRQDSRCRSNRLFLRWLQPARLPGAETRRWSKPCWVRGQGRPAPRFSTPAWRAAHWSARWPTWPIASNILRGVDATLFSVKPQNAGAIACFPVVSCSKPEQKNRGIEHEYRENPGRDVSHRGDRRMCIRSGNIQPILFQPVIRAVAGHRLNGHAPTGAVPGLNLNQTQRSVGRPWATGAVLRSA